MHALFILIWNVKASFLNYFFLMKTNQIFIVWNDLMGVKHHLHHLLQCDLIYRCLSTCFRTKFKHCMHNVSLVMHTICLHSSFLTPSTKTKNSNKYMGLKFNANTKLNHTLLPKQYMPLWCMSWATLQILFPLQNKAFNLKLTKIDN
jgi:hypothetical protein